MTMQLFTPLEYLMIDIANNYGLDKENWDTRIAWFKTNEDNMADMQATAKEPALFYAGFQAYRKAKAGQAIGYPISLDATSSGAQILAALIGCSKSALQCNLVDSGKREDLYTGIYQEMCRRSQSMSTIDRKDTKQAIMTALFGSVAVPKRVFGEGDLLDTFFAVMEDEAPGTWALNQSLLGLWQSTVMSHDWIMPDNFHVSIKVIDDHVDVVTFLDHRYEVYTKINRPMEEGRSISANLVHSVDGMIVREISRRCSYAPFLKLRAMESCINASTHSRRATLLVTPSVTMVQTLLKHYRETKFMSARIIEYINDETIQLFSKPERDALWELLESMPGKSFPVLAVHDCFRVHPNYANDLRKQYNQILYEIAKSNILEVLASQISGQAIHAAKYSNLAPHILESNYALS